MVWDLHAPTWRYSQLYMAEITTVAGCCNSNLLACKTRRACLRGREGLPSMQARSIFKAERACLQRRDGLLSRQRGPAFKGERAYLQGREGLVFGMASTSSQNLHLSCGVLQLSLQSCQGKLVLLFCPVLPLLAVLNLSSQSLDLWVT